jgi:hypothetical protein
MVYIEISRILLFAGITERSAAVVVAVRVTDVPGLHATARAEQLLGPC